MAYSQNCNRVKDLDDTSDQIPSYYNEISNEIDNNFLSIRVLKDIEQIQAVGNGNGVGRTPSNPICVNCGDQESICREGCAKLNIIPNKRPPPKKPEDSEFLLRSKSKIHPNKVQHTLEVEFKAPRNYIPFPEPGPPPPIIEIIPKSTIGHKSKRSKVEKKKKK